MPWQCCVNLDQKTDLIPLNVCQGFNVVDNITGTIRPDITISHFHQVLWLQGSVAGLRFLFMDPRQALELLWVSQLLCPCTLNQLCSLPAEMATGNAVTGRFP